MKKWICAFAIVFSCIFTFSNIAMASGSSGGGIAIDGNFNDWTDKPTVGDIKNDTKTPGLDFTGMQYYTDDQYLYLHLERKAPQKSDPWDFKVVILNANSGQNHENYPFGSDKPVYAPEFDVNSYFTANHSGKEMAINVSLDGADIETTFSASNNGKDVEIRIPLSEVGLNGTDKQVEFVVGSAPSEKTGTIDWIPNGEKIVTTTGPASGKWWTIICFAAVSILAYNVYRKKRA